MKVYVDGSGWNGEHSKYLVVRDNVIKSLQMFPFPYTNNSMEYEAVICALELVCEEGDTICTDSQLVVNQVNKGWKCNFPHLKILRDKAEMLLKEKNCQLMWIAREENLAGRLLEKR